MSGGLTLKRPLCVTEPFVHGSALEALDWDLYWELSESWPSPPPAKGPNMLMSYDARSILSKSRFSQVWKDFIERHTSREFAEATVGEIDRKISVRGTGGRKDFAT